MDDSKKLQLPLDEFLVTAPEIRIISQAREELVAQCLEKFGVQYVNKSEAQESHLTQNERRYGLADAELAKRSGYHVPALEGMPTLTLPSTTQKLLNGDIKRYKGTPVPSNGCLGEAQQKLQELETYQMQEEAQRINFESYKKSQTEPSIAVANQEWSECMTDYGLSYPDPTSAINDPKFKTPKPSKREKEVALADVTCKRKANIIGIWSSIESLYQQSMIRKSLKALRDGQRVKQGTLNIAKSILSSR